MEPSKDWRGATARYYGGVPEAAARTLQGVFARSRAPGMLHLWSDLRRNLRNSGLEEVVAVDVEAAFGGSGLPAETAAKNLGLAAEFAAGGKNGLRIMPPT